MKRVAYNEVILPTGQTISPAVVTFRGSTPVGCHPLLHEEPMVEWRGGTYIMI